MATAIAAAMAVPTPNMARPVQSLPPPVRSMNGIVTVELKCRSPGRHRQVNEVQRAEYQRRARGHQKKPDGNARSRGQLLNQSDGRL